MLRTILFCAAVIGVAVFVFSKMPGPNSESRVVSRQNVYRIRSKPKPIRHESVRVDEPKSQELALENGELLRACDDYSYEYYSFHPGPKALADKELLLKEASRELGTGRPTNETDIQNEISVLCNSTWAKNSIARDAINHRLYGNY